MTLLLLEAPDREGGQAGGHRGHLLLGARGEQGIVVGQRQPPGGHGLGQRAGGGVPVGVGGQEPAGGLGHRNSRSPAIRSGHWASWGTWPASDAASTWAPAAGRAWAVRPAACAAAA
jgi:hypothetical protein